MKNLLTLLLIAKLALFSGNASATTYYFSSSDGDDSRTSAQAQNSSTPWKSIDKLNSFFSSLQPGDQVLFKRGDVFYGGINISKSGSAGSPIVFGAYGSGNKPIISGFAAISSWTSVGNGLYEATVAAGLSTLNMVTLDGAFQVMGKYPKGNSGYLTISSGSTSSISSSGLSGIPSFSGGEIVWRPYHWTLWRATVNSQSSSSVSFTAFPSTSGGPTEAPQSGYGFFFQNHPNACTSLGEWAYNSSSHKITMYGAGSHVVKVSSIENLITLSGRSYISFDNIALQGANTESFSIINTNNITINACDIFFSGHDAVNANSGCSNIAVTNCNISYSNFNGIVASGSSAWTITGNTISNTATVTGMGGSGEGQYFGIRDVKNGSTVTLNKVTNTGYIAICFQGTNNTIQNNLVDTFCTVKDDGGGIYCGGISFTGSKVSNNIVLNAIGAATGTPDRDSRAHGIYVDDGGNNVEIAGNTVAFSGGAGIYNHNGHELNIHDNTSFDNRTTAIKYYNDGNTIANVTLTGNIFFAKTSSEYVLNSSGGSASPKGFFATADNNYWCRPLNENNSFQTLVPSGNYNLAGWKSFTGKESNSNVTPMSVTDSKNIRFEYNATSSSKVVNLGATYMDAKGKNYAGSITLAPFASAVLLYVSGTVSNQAPVANAGQDQNITLPTNTVTLTGSGTDPDGTIASYQWTKISGPSQNTVTSPTLAKTGVSNLAEGVYQFELKVTDNSGATAKDTVSVTVIATSNQPPVAKAGNSQSITLPTNSVSLDGSSSNDPDGTIASYQWTKILGPASAVILNPTLATTNVTSLTQGIYQFELRVTDNTGAVGKDTIQITVNGAPNQSPTANAGLNINITLPTNSVSLSGSGTDGDGTIASYQWTRISGPSQYNIVSPGLAQTSVNNLVEGTYQFELKVTDNAGASDRDTVLVTVNPSPVPNQSPAANAGLDINITLPNNSVSLSGSGNDADGTIASYQWTKISGPSQYNIGSPSQASTSVTNLAQGIYQFQLTVTDNSGASDNDVVQVTVNAAPNQVPSANAGSDMIITLPVSTVTLPGSGDDPDGTIVSYQWTKISGPSQYNIGSPSQASTSVTNLAQGTYQFQLTVTDNSGASDNDVVQVTVNAAPNQMPSADAGSDMIIALPVSTVTLSGSGNDPDGTIVSYQWTKVSGPTQYTIAFPTRTRTTIDNLTEGIYEFELQVTDNSGAVATDIVQVTVNGGTPQPNQSPNASAGPDLTITLPVNNVTLNGNGSDPDGSIASYQWTMISGPTQYDIASATQARTSVNDLTEGVYKFELQVTDNSGATDLDIVQITVNAAAPPPNQSPSADAGADIIITLPTNSTALSGDGTDPDGTIASYKWAKISGPSQYNIASPNTAQTSIDNLAQGTYTFELTVTDNSGASAKDTVQITVMAAPNQSPAADAGADINITLPTNSITLSGVGTDPDGIVASYRWTKIAGPTQYNIVSSTLAKTSVNSLVQGSYSFELTVTDNSGASAKDTIEVTVNAAVAKPNQVPEANAGRDIQITLPTNSTRLSGIGTDPDGQITSYRWRSVSGPKEFNINSPARSSTTINSLVKGTYNFELTVTDNSGATDKDTVVVTVLAAPPNQSPNANAGADISITLPTNSTSLSGSGSDPDGTIASYKWTKISGPAQYNVVSSTKAQASVNNLAKGVYQFELTVTDNLGKSAKDTVQVTVNAQAVAPNQAPTANAGLDINVTLPTNSVILSGSGTDIDGTIASYQWNKISGPSQFNIVSATQGKTTVNNLIEGTYKFELTVTDNSGASAKDTMQVIVNPASLPANQSPTADAGSNLEITLPTDSVQLSGKGNDVDGTIASYKWTKISGPAQYNIVSSTNAQTVVNGLVQGVYQFELTVTDNSNGSGKSTMQVKVNAAPNQSPSAKAGSDLQISMPTDTATLTGAGTDPDGTIASYKWAKISGPAQSTLASPSKPKTLISNLTEGVYQFELTVTDNAGSSAKDTVEVIVLSVPKAFAKVFPNPATSVINIQIEGATTTRNTALRIYDNKGILVYQEDFVRSPQPMIKQVNVSKLPGGIYFVELQTETSSLTTLRFIKK